MGGWIVQKPQRVGTNAIQQEWPAILGLMRQVDGRSTAASNSLVSGA
jgi:hypothetical protein